MTRIGGTAAGVVLRRAAAWAALLALGACASLPRVPYDEAEARRAAVPGLPSVRTWADAPDPAFVAAIQAGPRAMATAGGRATYLALSGGGGDGAFGAGILSGWTRSGTRPSFTIVSGVSTGALIAPFAFLGSGYDGVIEDLYTSGIAETLLESPDPVSAIFGASLFSNDRLRSLAARYVTPEIVAEVARERERGRFLLVVTTNLDSQRPVLWDMGAIARAGTPQAVALFRDVLVASASIPAVFPPILIDAEADGRAFQEMHTDGTVTSSVYTLPRSYLGGRRPGARRLTDLYVILNAKLGPDFKLISNRTSEIGSRSFSTFVKEQARADLARTETIARGRGIGFHIAAIGPEVPLASDAGFETAYMRRLFELGRAKAESGRLWSGRLAPASRAGSP